MKHLILIEEIYIPPEEDARIREPANLKKAVSARSNSMIRFGQLQPILIEELERPINGKRWKLVDGQTRLVAMMALSVRYGMGEKEVIEAFDKWGMKPDYIEVTTKETLDPEVALMMEFEANDQRENFSWEEKGRYIRRIHDMLIAKHGRKNWTAKLTAEYIDQSEATVSQYLALTDERDPAVKSESVKKATTKGAALKKLKIEKDRRLRQARVQPLTPAPDGTVTIPSAHDYSEPDRAAELMCFHGDSRQWIKTIPDEALDWFHWDPPYGGREGSGGAFASHEGIEIDTEECLQLMLDMLPEIWRTLHDGAWLVMWYTPVHYEWLRLTLQGHRFSKETGRCMFCDKHRVGDYIWLSENYTCRKSPFRFWVNPFPNYWRKINRVADGHEIQRFLIKETEPFFFAGKYDQRAPILLRSDRGNCFDFPTVPSSERRHVHHKPAPLLSEILTCISVPGAIGGDAGAGSGSIIEGAFGVGRRVVVSELREGYHGECVACARSILREKGYGVRQSIPWHS